MLSGSICGTGASAQAIPLGPSPRGEGRRAKEFLPRTFPEASRTRPRPPSDTHHDDSARTVRPDRCDELVLEHLPLVKAIASRMRVRLPAHLELSDLVQAGILGLLEAARKYNPGDAASFSTYATHRIKGAIFDSLRVQDPASRKLRRRHRELEKVRSELTQELQRSPTEPEISERSGIALDRLRSTTLDVHCLNQMCGAEGVSDYGDKGICNDSLNQPESQYARQARAVILKELIGKLPASYRMVITLHYTDDLSLKEIGGSAGVPERQVSRVHKRALERINAMLVMKGITSWSKI
jgi:RNA polymerase sigma factor for flagellar operon FliA